MRHTKLIPLYAAAGALFVHLAANPHYGFFRDELYFIVCGFRPAWGYLDQPPLAPLLAAGSQVFGDSRFLFRAVRALMGVVPVAFTCLIAFDLSEGLFSQLLASFVWLVCAALIILVVELS